MKKISSSTTNFRKKILPIILLISFVLIFCLLVFGNFTFRELSMLIFPSLIFTFAWLFEFRKLSEVYIEEKYLIIDDEKISFRDVISIERRNWPTYKVKYNSAELIKSFLFLPKINQLFLIEELRNKIFK